jgi:broad specificity phosphatase PhoE
MTGTDSHMRLILIRHAESDHAQRGVLDGPAGCTGLTEHGRQQAQWLAARLQSTGELSECRVLLNSPALRTRQTADILAPTLPGAVREENADLVELRHGAADGMTWEAYRAQYGDFDPVAAPTRPFAPGGESWSGFLARVDTILDNLAERYAGQTVVAVTHAGFIVGAFLTLFDIPRPGTRARVDPVYTSLTEWEWVEGVWRLARYNDDCHLRRPSS